MAISHIYLTGYAASNVRDNGDDCSFLLALPQDGTDVRQTFQVRCTGALKDHVCECVQRGDNLIIVGRMTTVETWHGMNRDTITYVAAVTVGHDLRFGVTDWEKTPPPSVRTGMLKRSRTPLGN